MRWRPAHVQRLHKTASRMQSKSSAQKHRRARRQIHASKGKPHSKSGEPHARAPLRCPHSMPSQHSVEAAANLRSRDVERSQYRRRDHNASQRYQQVQTNRKRGQDERFRFGAYARQASTRASDRQAGPTLRIRAAKYQGD